MTHRPLRHALIGMASVLSLVACSDDPETFEVSVFSTDNILSASGADSSVLTISVVSDQNNPPPAASTVILTCTLTETGQPSGQLASSGGSVTGTLVTDAQGFTEDEVSCSEAGTLLCIAIYDDVSAPAPPITCQPVEE